MKFIKRPKVFCMVGNSFSSTTKTQQGVSLLELIVAMGIFVIVALLVNGIYINIINYQKRSISSQTTQEAFRFAFEMMGKEMRSAQGTQLGSICGPSDPGYYKIFNKSSNDAESGDTVKLYFENKNGECVVYEKINDGGVGRVMITRVENLGISASGYITPNELNVGNLKFIITDNKGDTVGTLQPSITMMMEANIVNDPTQDIRMQTTISSREYTY